MSFAKEPPLSTAASDSASGPAEDGTASRPEDACMGYQQTLMYGRYSKSLGEYAAREAAAVRKNQLEQPKEESKWLKKIIRSHDPRYLAASQGQCYTYVLIQ